MTVQRRFLAFNSVSAFDQISIGRILEWHENAFTFGAFVARLHESGANQRAFY